MIRILKYGEVTPEQVFSRVEPAVNVEAIVSDIIANVRKKGDTALYSDSLCREDPVRLMLVELSDVLPRDTYIPEVLDG